MVTVRCVICDLIRERTPSGWCKECTEDFHRVLRAARKPRLSDPASQHPQMPCGDPACCGGPRGAPTYGIH